MFFTPKGKSKSLPKNRTEQRRLLLTSDEVAKRLRVSKKTVYRLVKSGEMPVVRVRRIWRFAEEDVNAFLVSLREGTKNTK
jgi:excisionase family DNA binding protein